MPRNVDPDSFGFLVTDVARLIRADFDRVVAESGLGITPGEARTLAHAARAGLVRQNVLAERMGVEAMTVTGFLDRLEAKQLVERIADPADRRAKLVQVTAAANEVLATINKLTSRVRVAARCGVAPQDWDQFMTVLKTARDNLAEHRCKAAAQSSAA
jgi:MarR family transcriptional regulator for hemolysin